MNKKVEAELEFYDACSMYINTTRTVGEGEERTYILIEVMSNDAHLMCGAHVVDPGMPEGRIDASTLTMAQQVAMASRDDIGRVLEHYANMLTKLSNLAGMMGMDLPEAFQRALERKEESDERG